MSDNEKKIVIDEDWKSQVEAEREKQREQQVDQPEAAGEQPGGPRQLPPASFEFHISNLATQAMMFLGQFPNPMTNKQEIRLDDAKHVIDTLAILDEKTKGNLDEKEAEMMEGVLHELRMAFVSVQQYVAQELAKRAGQEMEQAGGDKPGGIELP